MADQSERRRSILVVEDDADIRKMVCESLEEEGYRTTGAANGAQGLASVDAERPELVLLDLNMPICDGWAFARGMLERRATVPTVVMTAAAKDSINLKELGASALLSKPFSLIALFAAVTLALPLPLPVPLPPLP